MEAQVVMVRTQQPQGTLWKRNRKDPSRHDLYFYMVWWFIRFQGNHSLTGSSDDRVDSGEA
jgi:hypothetical protein